jgi:PAS domain S-box-containing protein
MGRDETGRIRILHLEDSTLDAVLVKDMLEQEGLPCAITLVSSQSSFEAALSLQPFDLVLCDHSLPGYDGFSALRLARERQPHVPVIMFSGSLDDAQAVESLKSGATDYILKQRLARLVPAIRRALREGDERKKKQLADERIQEQADLLNLTSDAVFVRTMSEQVVFWNKGAEALFGWTDDEAQGKDFGGLLSLNSSALIDAKKSLLQSGNWIGELTARTKTGREIVIFSRWTLLREQDGKPKAILSANTDITEKKKLEDVLLRAQRMESIGALAGGIAHDLNNALAPVSMCVELLTLCKDSAEQQKFLNIIASSVQRATGMVKQILGFARGSHGTGPVLMSDVVTEMAKIVKDTFPKSISLCLTIPGNQSWQIEGDTTELHQVLLNLCVNARDAMSNRGTLTLALQNVNLEQETAMRLKLAAGPYVLLSVGDTGSGIPPEVLPRIFEPFFTTKLPDKGTGLGLSTVASIVKKHGGGVEINTEPGKGTEFKIYLPAARLASMEMERESQKPFLPTGHGELILLIEDEEAIRELTKTTLENYGYRVITAQNGVQGIARFEEHKDQVRIVVTDTDMPFLDGIEAVRAIKAIKPDLPVIIASGSKRDTDQARRIDMKHTNLGKPFSADQLLLAVGMAIQN